MEDDEEEEVVEKGMGDRQEYARLVMKPLNKRQRTTSDEVEWAPHRHRHTYTAQPQHQRGYFIPTIIPFNPMPCCRSHTNRGRRDGGAAIQSQPICFTGLSAPTMLRNSSKRSPKARRPTAWFAWMIN